ncbi:MAG: MBL fold metallo-hydrolase [Oceanicaulis sp.]|jgi:glyoxylase-like metal-dependent hydrolase (beta-lactamase superfamily II)|uniref:MBL fold metallo-hydrolase n=1 Tax=Oceanicaulis sp. UBA6590 TaxID=1947008 RepID=UPI000C4921FD|nr:MBL fold metallo-hydrolase [Oceanicaulis sp. UBA6590]MAB70266.1 MBL fold metallo-hydrolase [Oceanicaulis sp.]MBG34637.1 MBL fold metallo-hydrolase [Oceanicaulis sp.]HBU61265.1 MBL fold metallo-hydrolase [Oceanicaulis sp.]|tara:strand:+ start:3405 stop:4289 length:885 start_codon:yes stop_codon:yes gene_type:complete
MTTPSATPIPTVKAFFDPDTFTVSYVVSDPATQKAAIIDSVLDYDAKSGRTSHTSADAIIAYVKEQGLDVDWVLETHVHADHLSAAPYLKEKLGGQLAIGANIRTVQDVFGKVFNAGSEFQRDGSQFDHLFDDDERFSIGELEARTLHTPGHTPACMTYVIGDAAFVGDTLFMPDFGTARCDFPGGDARTLYRSIQKIFALPDETRLFMCHDYKAPGRDEFAWETTVAEERASNIHVGGGIDEDSFVAMRERRDATLDMPTLILPSVQVNMRAGELPPAEDNGVRYLKIPFDAL